MEFRKVRAAAAQVEPVWLDAAASLEKAIGVIEDAARRGVELIVFPEVFIPGYPWWIWHGPFYYGKRFVSEYHANSIERDGKEIRRLARAARENHIIVVMGFSEYDRGSLYISQAIFSEHGELVGVRRKLKPTHVERSIFGDGSGVDLQVHQLSIGRLSALSCWEHIQPLSKYALIGMGAQVHAASFPNQSSYERIAYSFGSEVANVLNQAFALEGQLFVVEAHNPMTESGAEFFLHDQATREHLLSGGGCSRIWAPNGQSLVPPLVPDEEGLLIGELDFVEIENARAGADPAGHYSRPDIFQLHINRTPPRHIVEYWHSDAPQVRGGVHQFNGIPTTPVVDLLSQVTPQLTGTQPAAADQPKDAPR